jgi:hypothetical protein
MQITAALPFNCVKHDGFRLTIVSQITGEHFARIAVFFASFSFRLTSDKRVDCGGVIILKG